jgi:NitT/TauT family transport system substrate-binding protein
MGRCRLSLRGLRFARLYVCLVVLLLVPIALGCVPTSRSQGALTTLKVVTLPYLSFAPYYIAEKEGFFAEEGLEIEFVKLTQPADAYPALAKGELDVASANASAGMFNLFAREPRIKAVADKGFQAATACPNAGLLARRDLVDAGELSDPAQLKGRRLAIDAASYSGYVVDTILEPSGLSTDDVEIVDLPDAAAIEALAQGSVDVVSAAEPSLTRAVQGGKAVIWRSGGQVHPDFQTAVVIYGPNLLETNPDAGQRFMNAYLKGVRQYNQGKTARNLDIVAEATELDRSLLEAMCWPSFSSNGAIHSETLLHFQNWAQRKGHLDNVVAVDHYWQPRFVDQANRTLGAARQ